MTETRRAQIFMHIATFLFGLTAIFGKLITLGELNLVWHRMMIAAVFFMLIPTFWKRLRVFPKKSLIIFFFTGFIVALHWVTFYGAIKISNSASLALACFGTTAAWASILEPLLLRIRFNPKEILLGVLVLIGLVFIAKANPDQAFSFESDYVVAIGVGLISAFLAALFSVINKKYIGEDSPRVAVWAQMLGGWVFLSGVLAIIGTEDFVFIPQGMDITYLLLLSVLCTNVAFTLELEALKRVSAFVANLVINLEPVYGMILAAVIFQEHQSLNWWFYIGAILILLSVFLHPMITRPKAQLLD